MYLERFNCFDPHKTEAFHRLESLKSLNLRIDALLVTKMNQSNGFCVGNGSKEEH